MGFSPCLLLQGTGIKQAGPRTHRREQWGWKTMTALRSSSNSTAILGQLGKGHVNHGNGASTIFLRAAMITSACWRRALPAQSQGVGQVREGERRQQ